MKEHVDPLLTRSQEFGNSHTEEVHDILSRTPKWIVQWGITIIFGIVLVVLILSWIIKYPDTIVSKVVLTTRVPPSSIIARSNGRVQFLVEEGEQVKANEILAIIDNSARQDDVFDVKKLIASFRNGDTLADTTTLLTSNLQLGQLQNSYLKFLSALTDDLLTRKNNMYQEQIKTLQQRMGSYRHLSDQLENQNRILEKELSLAKKKLIRDSVLFQNRTTSAADWEKDQTSYLEVERLSDASKLQSTNNDIEILKVEAQINELRIAQKKEELQRHHLVTAALDQLESEVAAWEQQFVLTTPIDGKVSFTKYWSDAQFVQSNEEVMVIVPSSEVLYGKVFTPLFGSGKIEIGQSVYLKFDNYPFQEFGSVYSKVISMSAVPRNNIYIVEVELPHGLSTNLHKKLLFKNEMQGTAEIVTRDLRLLERLFNKIWAAANSKNY
ncbi:HlyD family efflux transporter periplasmic adaptor subunit [Chryseolinea sp. H1M3-3]|uniref:HlyD family secretion protein n=1 Tax=Chryseolinea sp. H1M3-3 TaxID=3034144 RepID=UPI0023EDEB71|nr:HlyD family efflux transporter periplasmic adaptor subunit [Chryseolinea sp. H1M3-3]